MEKNTNLIQLKEGKFLFFIQNVIILFCGLNITLS